MSDRSKCWNAAARSRARAPLFAAFWLLASASLLGAADAAATGDRSADGRPAAGAVQLAQVLKADVEKKKLNQLKNDQQKLC